MRVGLLDIFFTRLSFLFSFFLSLGDGPIQTEILSQRAIKPKITNQTTTMWKWETTAKGNFVYVSLLNKQGNCDFEFISVNFSAVTVGYIRYQHTVSLKSYDLKIESFCILFVAVST